jgi:hypothetical protein
MRRPHPPIWLTPGVVFCLVSALTADEKATDQPGRQRVRAGTVAAFEKQPVLLLARRDKAWTRVAAGAEVFTSEPLVCLPASAAEIRLASGGRLLLRGQSPEMAQRQIAELLLESAVTLHHNPAVDLDLTLDRGRIFLTNAREKGPLTVRLRVSTEVWDVVLKEPGSEIGVDLLRQYPRNLNWEEEEPLIAAFLTVLQGKASLKVGGYVFPNLEAAPGPNNFFNWDNKGPRAAGPGQFPETSLRDLQTLWEKSPRAVRHAAFDPAEGLAGLATALERSPTPQAGLKAALGSPSRPVRILALYSLGALDGVPQLLEALADSNPDHAEQRERAVFSLRRWLARGLDNNRSLYNPEKKQGWLTQAGYTPSEAHTIALLLHDFSGDDARKPEIFEFLLLQLRNKDRVALRELAYWQLLHLAQPLLPGEASLPLPAFNAAGPEAQRTAFADAVRKYLKEGQLPPPLPRSPKPPR